MAETNGSPQVPYSTKELFAEILRKLAVIEGALNKKAEVEDLRNLEKKVDEQGIRITVLETRADDKRNFWMTWAPAIATIIGAGIVIWAQFVK